MADRHRLAVEVYLTGEIRVTTDLYPEEGRHGALARGMAASDARRLAISLLQAAQGAETPQDAAVRDQRAPEALCDILVRTRRPEKWRFVDTETGEVWCWDINVNSFRRAADG